MFRKKCGRGRVKNLMWADKGCTVSIPGTQYVDGGENFGGGLKIKIYPFF